MGLRMSKLCKIFSNNEFLFAENTLYPSKLVSAKAILQFEV